MHPKKFDLFDSTRLALALKDMEPCSHLIATHDGQDYVMVRTSDLKTPLSIQLDDGSLIAVLPESHLQMLAAIYGPAEGLTIEAEVTAEIEAV